MNDHLRIIEVIKPLMLASSNIAMKHYRNLSNVQYKSDNSPLTDADLEIDHLIYERLSHEFPDIALITEEKSESHKVLPKEAAFFLVDPIDGTKEFINQRDEFTINIGLIENGEPVLGAVCVPAKQQLYIGSRDNGAFVFQYDMANDRIGAAIKLNPATPDNKALKIVASRSHLCKNTQEFIEVNEVGTLVNAGSSLKFCLLANGAADLYPRYGPTMEWDTAAGHAVLMAAGGRVDDLTGTPLKYGKKGLLNGIFIAHNPGVKFKIP
ncbi:MAG: 3'(2'),5'-bisphosphate nucleotidase CysQ [Hyphomicrobiales bacterium]|nr:3'(2'),5'-bisphosphate nucleotidase CysQ [Hyphomicrobiales bacterium]